MTEFVIMGNGTEYCEAMCSEIIGRGNVVFINEVNNLKSNFGKLLDVILQKVSNKTKLSFFRSVYFESYFCGASVPDGENIRFVFFDSNAHARDESFLKYIKNKYKAKLVLYVMNPTSTIPLDQRLCSNFYDSVFTIFEQDANSYGWHPYNHLYAKIPDVKPTDESEYDADVFFIGRAKNRLQNILRTYEFLVSHDIKCDFHISDVDKKDMRYSGDIIYNNWLPYKEVLRRMRRSKCLLEVLQRPGEGPTLRMVEAIVYNKKIITNDARASGNPFYDERFIQIFDDPKNIKLSFIKDDIQPDYYYQGEYSAKNFLKRIDEHFAADNKLPEKK